MQTQDHFKKNMNKEDERFNVWRSYSDMMAGLLLLFILVMTIWFIEAQKSYEAELQSQELQEQLSAEIEAQKKEVQEQQEKLKEQQNALDQQAMLVQNQQKIMAEQQEKIDNIIGVKADLIEDLKKEFEKENLTVGIDDETGAITFDSNILFEYNKSVLTREGEDMLSQMLPIYCQILLKEEYRDYLSEIIIDGFTDTKGSYDFNLKLSQNRAYAVTKFLLDIDEEFLSEKQCAFLESKLSTNGRSKSNPILTEDNQIDMDASRRVEVKFRLKDEEMITELQKIMSVAQ